MVVVNDGKNRIRDLISADIYTAKLGTDSTAVSTSDTDLGASVALTQFTPVQSTGNKIVNSEHTLPSTTGTGTTYYEKATYVNSGAVLLSRAVFPGYSHTANTELHSTDVYRIQ